jgi:thioredoxin reductase (NADPH)
MNENEIYDVIIIGGGPAGLSAALYTARARLKTMVLDKNPSAGALGSADRIENYPGISGAMKGSELLALFRKQAQSFGAQIKQEQVFGIDIITSPKQIITNDKTYIAKSIIIATGSMGRKAGIKGEAELIGRGVSYCATCDAAFYKDKDVALAGKIEEIIEETETLAKFAKHIYLITREKELSAEHASLVQNLKPVILKTSCHIEEIKGDSSVNGISIAYQDGKPELIAVSGVFLFLHGNKPVTDFLYGAVDTNPEGCIKVSHETMSASVEGVFAIGDVTCKKIRQVVVSASEGCIAALAAEQYINKKERISSQWSH